MKHYLCRLISETTDDLESADAVEYAIYSGFIRLTYDLQRDKTLIQNQLITIMERFHVITEANQQLNAPMLELVGQIHDWK